MKKTLIIYGGSSEISKHLIHEFNSKYFYFIIFCRNDLKVNKNIKDLDLDTSRFTIFKADLNNLNLNLELISKIESKIDGIIWVAGYTGVPDKEILNTKLCEQNYRVNLINPVLIINNMLPKLSENSFISIIASLAGIRGRSKRLFYSSAKGGLINYASGLRQHLWKKNIFVNTVIPGYMDTESFNITAPKFLISKPKDVARKIYLSITNKKEITYTNIYWRIISLIIFLLPEKVFKRLNF